SLQFNVFGFWWKAPEGGGGARSRDGCSRSWDRTFGRSGRASVRSAFARRAFSPRPTGIIRGVRRLRREPRRHDMAASIMVPLDGSAFSEHALPVALGIARR